MRLRTLTRGGHDHVSILISGRPGRRSGSQHSRFDSHLQGKTLQDRMRYIFEPAERDRFLYERNPFVERNDRARACRRKDYNHHARMRMCGQHTDRYRTFRGDLPGTDGTAHERDHQSGRRVPRSYQRELRQVKLLRHHRFAVNHYHSAGSGVNLRELPSS